MIKYLKKYNAHSDYIKPVILKAVVSYCKKEVEVHFKKREHDYSKDYLTFESLEDNNSFFFIGTDSNYLQTILVSLDNGETWTEKSSSLEKTTMFTLNKGEKVLIKSNSWHQNSKDNFNENKFNSYKKYKVYGNIASLLYGDNFLEQTTISIIRAFQGLFYDSGRLTDASNLMISVCAVYTCYYMFMNCSSLKYPPKITATTTGSTCYMRMFLGCSKLEYCPELPSVELSADCYRNMFQDCKLITSTPIIPAMTMKTRSCDSMFLNCTNLTSVCELPATTLELYCYTSMFQGCTSLVKAQDILPATSLPAYCYQYMFSGCTSLILAPELPAISLGGSCYYGMFNGCTSLLTPPPILGTIHESDCCALMFNGCINLTASPKLPAVNLATRSYRAMFKGCTSLVLAPELPAQTLVFNCYYEMFLNCTSLNFVKAKFTTDPGTNLTNWLDNVSPTGIFIKNPEAEWELRGPNGIPEGWSVTTNFFDSKIEYLESNGVLYLDTQYDIGPDNISNMKLYVDCIASSAKSGGIWRVHGIGGGYLVFHVGISNGSSATTNIPFVYGNGTNDGVTSIKGSLDVRYKYLVDFKNKIYLVTDEFNNTLIDTVINPNTNISKTYSPYIFAWRRGSNGSLGDSHSGKIYSYKLYDDDILVRDFIPVRVGTTGYLYDMISGLLFGNIGTGNFTLGPDIN